MMKIAKTIFNLLMVALSIVLVATQKYVGIIHLSIALSFCPLLILLAEWIARLCQKGLPTYPRQGMGSVALMVTAYLMAATCLLRYGVSGYVSANPDIMTDPSMVPAGSSIGVQLVESLLLAVRTIGITEDYTLFVEQLKAMWAALYPEQSLWRFVIVHYASFLNIAIPVAGSTLILGMFAQIFPRLMLWLKYKNPFRTEKCYFSGLNPQSLALAKSILITSKADGKKVMPLIVFTDAYMDDESEQSSELMLEAKRLGAICVRDDISHVLKTGYGERKYFLMEEEEYANLPALMSLVEEYNAPFIKDATIYMFVQTDVHLRLEQTIRRQLMDKSRGKKALTEEELPAIIPVNAHRNLVNNLMVDVPLYEPLVEKNKRNAKNNELTITIFGNGSIGTEAFLSAYWFGRMMVSHKDKMGTEHVEECKLVIHVVSQDDEETFWAKMDSINPDILCTTQANNLLLAWREGAYNDPYCVVHYHKADAKAGRFTNLEEEKTAETKTGDDAVNVDEKAAVERGPMTRMDAAPEEMPAAPARRTDPQWMDTDYVIVALGSDADNIAVANKLRADIGKRHLEGEGKCVNTVIAYVVYNSELCHALNEDSRVEYGVYMRAFGDLDEVYGCKNVFMTENQLLAEEANKAYYGADALGKGRNGKRKKPSRTYNQMASMARAMHHKYKVFSLGWITTSLFTPSEEGYRKTDEEEHRKRVETLRRQYKRVAVVGKMAIKERGVIAAADQACVEAETTKALYGEDVVLNPDTEAQSIATRLLNDADYEKWCDLYRYRHVLAWLEHRRWSAYTRTMGYRSTDAMERYYFSENDHKNMTLKLHPCLVEARPVEQGTKRTYVYTHEAFWQQPVADLCAAEPDADALDVHHILRWRAMAATWDILLGMPLEAKADASEETKTQIQERRKRMIALYSRMGSKEHCKKYDYFFGEVSDYESASAFYAAVAGRLDIRPEQWAKQCEMWKSCGAFLCPKGAEGEGEWLIPKSCLAEYVQRFYPLTLEEKKYCGPAVAEGEVPAPFAIRYNKKYYAADTKANRGWIQRMETAYTKKCDEELTDLLLAELAKKERNKTAASGEEA